MKWTLLAALAATSLVEQPAPTVVTTGGLVRGRLSTDGTHHQYFGIPYGTVNDTNRFQAPFPPPTWEGIFEANNENSRCPQQMIGSLVMGETDCLKLNIYTPSSRHANELLPVMVYIHGGVFKEGTGSGFLYGGDFFVEHGVVFVGINYRLNIEGFLCLGIKEAPGNAGLKDQVAALRWIQKNIKQFGGDPDNITLFGESAGATSTSFLILSEAAKGLFHKAILQSGSSLAPWALQQNPIKTATALAKELGHHTSDPTQLYNIFKSKTYKELIDAVKNPKNKNYVTAEVLFSPCIEKYIDGVESIITKHPEDIITSGNYSKLPMVIGFNDKEGIYFVAKDYGNKLTEINRDDTLQSDLEFSNEYEKNLTIDKVMELYFPYPKENIIDNLVDLYSDLFIKFPSIKESELYAKTSDKPIYHYLFKYSGYINMPKMISQFWFTQGASHADELFYMFKAHSFPLPHRYLERIMLKRMLTLWTNFAKYNDPTPTATELVPLRWTPSPGGSVSPRGLLIDGALSTGPLWDDAALALWNDTYSRYRRKHYGFNSFSYN